MNKESNIGSSSYDIPKKEICELKDELKMNKEGIRNILELQKKWRD